MLILARPVYGVATVGRDSARIRLLALARPVHGVVAVRGNSSWSCPLTLASALPIHDTDAIGMEAVLG